MGVIEDILDWSPHRPLWQRDALRRLVTQGTLTETDFDELTQICLQSHGAADPGLPVPAAQPLEQRHLPSGAQSGEPVRLLSLRDVQGVNALAPGQTISFAPEGLTVIFGYNGAGKSGYARVLRALCRARQPVTILPNAFGTGTPPRAAATIEYQVGSGAGLVGRWEHGTEPPADLGRVSFFDSQCATVHVNSANEVAFTPFGLDVFAGLVGACSAVKSRIEALVAAAERSRPAALASPPIDTKTSVAALLADLPSESAVSELQRLSAFEDGDEARHRELEVTLSANSVERARELGRRLSAISVVAREYGRLRTVMSQESLDELKAKYDVAISKRAAATLAATQAFDAQPLPGVGDSVWREMWDAARRYSEHVAYGGERFPHVGDDAVCVLCQQPLDSDAKARLNSFEEFIQADTERMAGNAEAEFRRAASPLLPMRVGLSLYREWWQTIRDLDRELRADLWEACSQASRIRMVVRDAAGGLAWPDTPGISTDASAKLGAVEEQASLARDDAERAASADERVVLKAELADLAARKWLSQHWKDIEKETSRLRRLLALSGALSDTDTRGITRKSSEVTDQYVTQAICDGMASEMQKLGAGHVRVNLSSAGGQLGQKRLQVSLQDAMADVSPASVLSEGEFRCVALAAFLAELATDESSSALVFDDPVSSLDHFWKRRIAVRLSELSKVRQVVVFTHDIAFLTDLVGETDAGHRVHVRTGPEGPGECLDGLPWEAMKVNARIGHLKNSLQSCAAAFRRNDHETLGRDAKLLYGLLRETWERAVEEVLLNGTVMRFGPEVHTRQLAVLTDIVQTDVERVNAGMTKSSRFLPGHDTPGAGAEPMPDPQEIAGDIKALEDWVAEVRRRR